MPVEEIERIARETLAAHLAPARLTAVLVAAEVDAEGEPVLRLRAVVDADGPDLAPQKVFSATGKLRVAFEAIGETRFPLLTFPSSTEFPSSAFPGVAA